MLVTVIFGTPPYNLRGNTTILYWFCNKMLVLISEIYGHGEQEWVIFAPPWLSFLKMKQMHFGALNAWCADW